MSATIQHETGDLYMLRIAGTLKRSEIAEAQQGLAREIDSGVKPRVLVLLEDFCGFERGADWDDFDFQFMHADSIVRIAIVGERRFEGEALAFAGAGFRSAPVQFFPPESLEEARAWVAA